jgi:nicotinamide-nucleotide amidase
MKGGIVAYNIESKAQLLNVDRQLLGERGAVNAEVAIQMARGARSRFDATFGVSTTGEAGIYSQSGAEVGKVFIALSSLEGESVEEFQFDGSRDEIRWSTMLAVLQTLDGLLPIVDPDFGAMGMSGEGRPPRS